MHKRETQLAQQQPYYSIESAAAYLAIGQTTLCKAVQGRKIKHARIGKSIRISHDGLLNWVDERTMPTLKELKTRNDKQGKLPRLNANQN
jgi:excisionase family DNA binding protein